MADSDLKVAPVMATEKSASPPQYAADEPVPEFQRPPGWMYKEIKLGRWSAGWYASPRIQLGMVAFVCFLCPGMFNALSGLGGGGKTDAHLADNMVCLFFFCLAPLSKEIFFSTYTKMNRTSP